MRAKYDFSGGVVLVTGGAQGIGAALARACRAAGATVVVADVAEAAGRALAGEAGGVGSSGEPGGAGERGGSGEPGGLREPGSAGEPGAWPASSASRGAGEPGASGASSASRGTIEFAPLDVTDNAAVDALVADVVARHGRIDGLVCGAIVQPLGSVLDADPAIFRRAMEVNFWGVVACCRAVGRVMAAQRSGAIVMYASGTASLGKAGSGAYTSSKGAVAGFQKTFALEMKPFNVRVNLYRPGIVDTPQFAAANPGGVPAAILDQPDDAVGGLMFLLSDDAVMTGSVVAREMPFSRAREAVVA
jgi:3-oxoacyl-[acyl-carrier protein] reductase